MTKIKKETCLRVITFVPVLTVMAVIFYFSSQTAEASTVTSGGIVDTVLEYIIKVFGEIPTNSFEAVRHTVTFVVRKAAHFSEFAALGFFLYVHIFTFCRKKIWLYGTVVSVLYAASDELHQHFVSERAPRLGDVCVDTAGAVFGIGVACVLILIICKVKSRRNNQ